MNILATLQDFGIMFEEEEKPNILQVVEQVSKIYDMTVAQQKERQMKAEGLSNDMATSGSDGFLRYPVIYVLGEPMPAQIFF